MLSVGGDNLLSERNLFIVKMSMKVSEYKVPKWAECMKPAPAKVVQVRVATATC